MKRTNYIVSSASAKGRLVAKLAKKAGRLTVICQSRAESAALANDLRFFNSNIPVFEFPAWEALPFEAISPPVDLSAQRIKVLKRLQDSSAMVVVAPVEALLQRLLDPSILNSLDFNLKLGDQVDRNKLITNLDACGFRRVSLVEAIGDYALRGGVIDLFPSATELPVRLEFNADNLEQIKLFETESQRTCSDINSITISAVRESLSFPATEKLKDKIPELTKKIKKAGKVLETPPRELARTINAIKTGADLPGIELAQAIALSPLADYFDYLTDSSHLFVLSEPAQIEQKTLQSWDIINERFERLSSEHYLIPEANELYLEYDFLRDRLNQYPQISLNDLDMISEEQKLIKVHSASNLELQTRLKTQIGTGSAFEPLKEAVLKWREAKQRIAFVVGNIPRAERLQSILLELGLDAPILQDLDGEGWINRKDHAPLSILIGHLSSGVQLKDEDLVFVAESEIFGERSYRKSNKKTRSLKRLLSSLSLLKEGDYVVHTDYGIGIYQGLKHLDIEDRNTDLLQIAYADSQLYLPVHNISKVQRFIGANEQKPALDKLGSQRWSKTKIKVKKSVAALTGDLIKLYATRSVARGWSFEPYGAEDERFADGFPFNETTDQMSAIEATLADMASKRPMDRLICGDVGFGKTEVALRAAYKCVQHARQVALLAPTTILVEQHFETFKKRFASYPVKVAAISRFYSPAENKATLEQLAAGKVDIIIGTHRILQRDVIFSDLGLYIVDEEHRFGVKQKERIKQLKKQVDVLTLTATPIPRTLHMSLLDVRDISIISSPPTDRQTVRTYTANFDKTLIRDAVLREIQRGGQAFFVHNKVQDIEHVCAVLSELIPEARLQFAHGQMSEVQLEKIMMRFMRHEIDVLVCTTIIESGIDIPNANTILINRADMFGLAQLYQLRGRVGRSKRQAYCYFLIPEKRKLGSDALKRLKVLQSLDELGQGFNLAIRDLEIRGAGNLLGKEQSGSVMAVGFELYTKILKEAVHHLKGETLSLEEVVDPELNLEGSAYIPETYIPDISERLILYQRLAALHSEDEAYDLTLEIEDRFGPMGEELTSLIQLMTFRAFLRHFGVLRADLTETRSALTFSPQTPVMVDKIVKLVQSEPDQYRLSKNMTFSIKWPDNMKGNPEKHYPLIKQLLSELSE